MQQLPHAGVKLNYPLLSDITKGISAEYEVSQPHLLPVQVACLPAKPLHPFPYPHAPVPAVASRQCCTATPSLSCSCRRSSCIALAAVLSFTSLV